MFSLFLTTNCYLVVGVSPSKMKSGRSFVSGSAAAAARLRKLFEKIIRENYSKKIIPFKKNHCNDVGISAAADARLRK